MAIKLENYDKGIEELIKIVNTLEKEQLSLEKSIELYKKGMKLHKELVDILEKKKVDYSYLMKRLKMKRKNL